METEVPAQIHAVKQNTKALHHVSWCEMVAYFTFYEKDHPSFLLFNQRLPYVLNYQELQLRDPRK